jgi:hypothetical protein
VQTHSNYIVYVPTGELSAKHTSSSSRIGRLDCPCTGLANPLSFTVVDPLSSANQTRYSCISHFLATTQDAEDLVLENPLGGSQCASTSGPQFGSYSIADTTVLITNDITQRHAPILMSPTGVHGAHESFRPQRAAAFSPPHIDLAAEWQADIQPRPKDKWCPACEWDGSWQNLLHRPQDPEEERGNNEVSWVWTQSRPYSRSSLEASARSGNLCCAAVLAYCTARWGNNNAAATLSRPSKGSDLRLTISAALLGGGTGSSGQSSRQLFALRKSQGDMPLAPGIPCLSVDTYRSVEASCGMLSRESGMAWAKRRIDDCVAQHPRCRAAYVGFLPTRLLFIPPYPEKNGVHLRQRDSVPPDARYAALSHCWGPEKTWPECQTTVHNYEQQLRGIAWAAIPPTFAEAIAVTQQLGLEYIWIDSLCIIQQDEVDWQLQAVTMHQVYSNAYITLAAADSSDSRGGLWPGPSLHWETPELLMTFSWEGTLYPLYLFSEPPHPTWGVVQGARFEPWDRPPLLTRAWAFQERMVSPRTLFFAPGSLVWDCFTQSEAQPDQLSELLRRGEVSPCQGPKQHFADYSTASEPAGTSVQLWHQIVSQYTRLRLSVTTDKLPGIAAVAQSIHASRRGDEYICGLWRSTLIHDLLWEPKYQPQYHQAYTLIPTGNGSTMNGHDDQPAENLEVWPYTGPSWSWASSFTAVTFPLESERIATPKMQLISSSIKVQDDNPFGRISPGSHITVQVTTLAGTWKPAPSNYMHGNRCWLRLIGARRRARGQEQIIIGDICFKLDFRRWRNWAHDACTDAVLGLIGLTATGQARALVLHRFPNTETYQRIGILLSPKDVMFNEICESLPRIFEENGEHQIITLT